MNRKTRTAHYDKKTEILAASIPMFAAYGYNKVTIRELGAAAGVTSSALYYHFSDKQTLYREALKYSFRSKAEISHQILSSDGDPAERLSRFIDRYTQLLADDPDFRRVMQRELLDGNEVSVSMLSELFQDPFNELAEIVQTLAPGADVHMQIMSIIAMILYHFEVGPLRRLLPGSKEEHEDYRTLAAHINHLIFAALDDTKNHPITVEGNPPHPITHNSNRPQLSGRPQPDAEVGDAL